MLQAHNLAKHYGGRDLFDNLSWQIQPGERIGLVGPNGAGKSTLLRLIVGELSADGGSVSLGREETVGYLPQEAPRTTSGSILDRVLQAAERVQAMGARLATIEADMAQADAAQAAALATEHAELTERFRMLDGFTLEARAREVLVGLGFAPDALDGPVTSLSGGWWMRVELARLLLVRPDYLLLDEPTNHLDHASLAFLESFLQRYPGAWVAVSHDRYFLNRQATRIAELTPEGLVSFVGNYDAFVEARQQQREQQQAAARTVQRKRDALTGFVERFGAKASKAKQAQSRVKQLEKLGPAPQQQRRARTLRFALPQPRRSGAWLVRLEGVHKQYGDKIIYHGLDMELRRGERIALVGPNGAGKSTLLKLLAGATQPDSGARQVGHNVDVYYFAQHQLDVLDSSKTVLQQMQASMPPNAPIAQVRGILGAFLFGQDSVDKRVGILSGGEKSRLVLAQMLATPANLLLLDEPTNHLDLPSRDMLEDALAQYEGTIVCISHDRYFLDRVATQVVEIAPGGGVQTFPGDFSTYMARRDQAERASVAPSSPASGAPPPTAHTSDAGSDSRTARKANQRAQARLKKQQQALEESIAASEARLKAIDALLCDADVYADAPRCKQLMDERAELDQTLTEQMVQWEALA